MSSVQQRNAEMAGLLGADLLSAKDRNLVLSVSSPQTTFDGTTVTVDFDTVNFNSSGDLYALDTTTNIGEITIKKKGIYLILGSVTVRPDTTTTANNVFAVTSEIDEGSGFGTAVSLAFGAVPHIASPNIAEGNAAICEIRMTTVDDTKYRVRIRRDTGPDTLEMSTLSRLIVVCLMLLD